MNEVKCPTCKTPVPWNGKSVYKPFCSERCKLIDLGEWASESHRIPGEQSDDLRMLDSDAFPEGNKDT